MSENKLDLKDNGLLADGRVVLCGANAYEQKYYFNEKFSKLPEPIKEELHIMKNIHLLGSGTKMKMEKGILCIQAMGYSMEII